MAGASESLVGTLCRESCWLRGRASQILADLQRAQNPVLMQRLQRELEALAARRGELQQLCRQLRRSSWFHDSLALELLEELCRRPLVCA